MKLQRRADGKETALLMCGECGENEFNVVIYEGELLAVCCGCEEAMCLEGVARPGEAGATEVRWQ